ncbi:hypothetical protein [Microbulbifer variabilis]|uniref:hypothetical protein n=1 Tax=Microbulbifer variabilis TaxID=266805 RepID=UPI000378E574|nr:hypothetical protein [Microbulbifer variabilis]
MALSIKKLIIVVAMFLLSGCYPINKTLQPASMITVQNESGEPLQDATVTLVSNAYPYGFEKTRMSIDTNYKGEAVFPKIKEWRVEALMIHGAEVYFWNWCVYKEGYFTYLTKNGSSKDFNRNATITMLPGASEPCPREFN